MLILQFCISGELCLNACDQGHGYCPWCPKPSTAPTSSAPEVTYFPTSDSADPPRITPPNITSSPPSANISSVGISYISSSGFIDSSMGKILIVGLVLLALLCCYFYFYWLARRDLTHKEMQKWIDKAALELVNYDGDQVYGYEDRVIKKLEPIRNTANTEPNKITKRNRRQADSMSLGNPVYFEKPSPHPSQDIEAPDSPPGQSPGFGSGITSGRRPRRRTNSIDLGSEKGVTMEPSNGISLPSPHKVTLGQGSLAKHGYLTPRSRHSDVETVTSYYQTHGRTNNSNNGYSDSGSSRRRSNSYELSQLSQSSASVSLNSSIGSHHEHDHSNSRNRDRNEERRDGRRQDRAHSISLN